ncbi:MAG: TIGR01212 family radical SAM protein [Desulfatibacillaceae bacterium]
MDKRHNDLAGFLRTRFGCRVQKITVDAGLTCPNRDGSLSTGGCAWCNALGSGTGMAAGGLSVSEQLRRGIERASRRYKAKKYIAYFQSYSNTYAPVEGLRELWEEALSVPGVVGLSIGTRPDCVSDPVLDLLESYARDRMVWVEYGLQTANDATLRALNRGHDSACFADAVRRTRGRGILVCAHTILGLPGETRGDMRDTADFVAGLDIDGIKLHLLYVVRNTALARMYERGEFRCLSLEEYADLVCDMLERLPENVVIQRLTGDPHPGELLAPQWALDKNRVRGYIFGRMEERDVRQGRRAQTRSPVLPL